MGFDPRLTEGQVVSNSDIMAIFKCSGQGGMRRSHRTKTLVLTTTQVKDTPYSDRWIRETLHYTGMGQIGDQRLDYMQNRTLNESDRNGIEVFCFEVEDTNRYRYVGQMELADEPYQETQPGADQAVRKVWVFPLKVVTA